MKQTDITPIKKAEAFAIAKVELGDIKKVAARFSVSDRTITKHLKLLNLPPETQDRVDKGELSITKALKGFSGNTAVKKLYSGLSNLGYLALEHLYTQRYMTIEQMASYLGESYRKASEVLADLKIAGYVDVEIGFKPYAYWLSYKGATRLGCEPLKRWKSANALHQELMRNQIEIEIKLKNPTAKFVSRVHAMQLGLNPSNGEYLLSLVKNKKPSFVFVLIDDYQMPPDRVKHSFFREHNPSKDFYDGPTMRFKDLADNVLIYVTDENRMRFHRAFYEKSFQDLAKYSIKYEEIKPIWKGVG